MHTGRGEQGAACSRLGFEEAKHEVPIGASGNMHPVRHNTSQYIIAMVTVGSELTRLRCSTPFECGMGSSRQEPVVKSNPNRNKTNSPADFLLFRWCTRWKRLAEHAVQAEQDSAVIARSSSRFSVRKFLCCICRG